MDQLSPEALALLRNYMQLYPGPNGGFGNGGPDSNAKYFGGARAAGSNAIAPQGPPQLQWYRAGANAADAFGMNDIQRATGLNLDPTVGISGLWNPNIPPQRRIQEDFRQFPGYY